MQYSWNLRPVSKRKINPSFLVSSGISIVLVGLILSAYKTWSENHKCTATTLCIGCKSELHIESLFHSCDILFCYLKVLWGLSKQEWTLQICSVFSKRKEHFNKSFLSGNQRIVLTFQPTKLHRHLMFRLVPS